MAGPRLNRVYLMGRLTRDPELRYTPSGTAVADLGLAVDDDYTSADGVRHERTCFVDVTVWGRQAETSCEYLSKGRPVLVEGRLQMDTWETQDGQKRSKLKVMATQVQFLGAPNRGGPGEVGEGAPRRPAAGPGPGPGAPRPRPTPAAPPRGTVPPGPEPGPEPEPEPEGDADATAGPPTGSDIPF